MVNIIIHPPSCVRMFPWQKTSSSTSNFSCCTLTSLVSPGDSMCLKGDERWIRLVEATHALASRSVLRPCREVWGVHDSDFLKQNQASSASHRIRSKLVFVNLLGHCALGHCSERVGLSGVGVRMSGSSAWCPIFEIEIEPGFCYRWFSASKYWYARFQFDCIDSSWPVACCRTLDEEEVRHAMMDVMWCAASEPMSVSQ